MAAEPTPRKSKRTNSRRTTSKQRRYQHLLDVSVRSDQAVRQRKRRLFSIVSKVLLVVGVIVGVYFGATKAMAYLLLKNPEYNVAELNVETDGVLQPEVVLQTADLHKGTNIFLLNLSRATARVEAIPEVQKVQITRQLPNRITIQITERKPIAWIAVGQGPATREEVVHSKNVYFIDARAILLQPRKITPQDAYLPLIRGYSGGPLTDGQEAEGEEVHAALDLIHAHQDSLIAARFQIETIDLSKHFGLEVTDRNGMKVLFGLDEMDRQLKRLDVYLQTIDQRGQKLQTINLLAQRNIPITFVTAPAADKTPEAPAASPTQTPGSPKNTPPGKDKSKSKPKTTENRHRH